MDMPIKALTKKPYKGRPKNSLLKIFYSHDKWNLISPWLQSSKRHRVVSE